MSRPGAAREPYRPDASVALRVGHSLCRSQKNHKHCRVVVAKAVLNSPTIHRTSSKSCPKNQPAWLIGHREKDAAGMAGDVFVLNGINQFIHVGVHSPAPGCAILPRGM